jgi:4a-hydroxytetrahydrobiopterin dehydratase
VSALLSEKEITVQLAKLPLWSRAGKEILRTIECDDFVRAMGLVNSIALLAERADHHPDIDIRWNKVLLTLSTHSAGGLTEKDFALAEAIDKL